MGWSNYLLLEDKKVALEFSRHIDDSFDADDLSALNELLKYIAEEEDSVNGQVIEYIRSKYPYTENLSEPFLAFLRAEYSFGKMVHEDQVPDDYIKVQRMIHSNF